jgi:hypothetical protein
MPLIKTTKTYSCEISYKFGSVRREIFIAFAQSGAADSLHPLSLNTGNSLKSW